MENGFPVLDKGYVHAEDYFINEALIAGIARLSHGKEVGDDEKTIQFLLKHEHTGPLEASCIVFKIKAPIFVLRQWQRHRIGQGFTERSLRYCEANPEFYCCHPGDQKFYDEAWKAYQQALEGGDKKEQARRFLPVGLYSETYWYPNLVALRHWLLLRLNNDAQYEIRQYARAILRILKNIAPITAKSISDEVWE
jgi:thymidylate synthase (FAD)